MFRQFFSLIASLFQSMAIFILHWWKKAAKQDKIVLDSLDLKC